MTDVAKFIARVEFQFEAEAITDGDQRLRRLNKAAEAAGFKMIRGEVHPAPKTPEDPEKPGWTGYGPKIDPTG
jgi:hypothetical protein